MRRLHLHRLRKRFREDPVAGQKDIQLPADHMSDGFLDRRHFRSHICNLKGTAAVPGMHPNLPISLGNQTSRRKPYIIDHHPCRHHITEVFHAARFHQAYPSSQILRHKHLLRIIHHPDIFIIPRRMFQQIPVKIHRIAVHTLSREGTENNLFLLYRKDPEYIHSSA